MIYMDADISLFAAGQPGSELQTFSASCLRVKPRLPWSRSCNNFQDCGPRDRPRPTLRRLRTSSIPQPSPLLEAVEGNRRQSLLDQKRNGHTQEHLLLGCGIRSPASAVGLYHDNLYVISYPIKYQILNKARGRCAVIRKRRPAVASAARAYAVHPLRSIRCVTIIALLCFCD